MDTFMAEHTDGLPDDRVTCKSCRNLIPWNKKCREFERFGVVIVTLPRRCVKYSPIPAEPDQRPGAERWPDIVAQIEETRVLERAKAAS